MCCRYPSSEECSEGDQTAVDTLQLIATTFEEAAGDQRVLEALFALLGAADQKHNAQVINATEG